MRASTAAGPLRDFYEALPVKGGGQWRRVSPWRVSAASRLPRCAHTRPNLASQVAPERPTQIGQNWAVVTDDMTSERIALFTSETSQTLFWTASSRQTGYSW